MRASIPWILSAGMGAALAACEVHDRVLTPDPIDAAGMAGHAGSFAGAGAGGANGGGAGGASSGGTAGSGAAAGSGAGGAGPAGGTAGGGAAGAAGATGGNGTGGAGMVDSGPDGTAGSSGREGGSDAPADTVHPAAQDPDCDLNGIWIAQQIAVATALGAAQYGNFWSYLEIQHQGADFVVRKQFDCGGQVKGTFNVTLREVTTRALMTHNRQTGRRGTMKKGPTSTCDLALERFWSVRGAVEASFLPAAGRNSNADLSQVQMERPLPRPATPAGAEDWDMDSHQGMGWDVAGVVTGRRHSVQRDWSSWFTDTTYTIIPATNWTGDIMARVEADLEDSVFETEPAGNLLLATGAVSDIRNVNNRVILKFLGRTANDPRAVAIPITGTDPEGNAASTLATCHAIQAAMPAKQAR
jgi:hypothetical protein